MNWPHTAHNNTRESPRYIFYYFYDHSFFYLFKKKFKSFIAPLIFIFITYYYFAKRKERPYFLKQTSYLYIHLIISVLFGICYQLCTFKNPMFSTHFYLGVRLLAWLLSPPLDPPSPPDRLYLLPPPTLLYPTLWISLGKWLLAGSVSLLLIPPFILLATSVSFLPLLFSV